MFNFTLLMWFTLQWNSAKDATDILQISPLFLMQNWSFRNHQYFHISFLQFVQNSAGTVFYSFQFLHGFSPYTSLMLMDKPLQCLCSCTYTCHNEFLCLAFVLTVLRNNMCAYESLWTYTSQLGPWRSMSHQEAYWEIRENISPYLS